MRDGSKLKAEFVRLSIEWCAVSVDRDPKRGIADVKRANRVFDKLSKVSKQLFDAEGADVFKLLIQHSNNCVRFWAAAGLISTDPKLAASIFTELMDLQDSEIEIDRFLAVHSELTLTWGFPNS